MKRYFYLLAILCFFSPLILSSQTKLEAIVVGLDTRSPLVNASISLINKSDSILIGFTRTDNAGKFVLPIGSTGNFILFTSYPGFIGQSYDFEIKNGETTKLLDSIRLMNSEILLGEITVVDSRAIVIKGDTIQFSADKFITDKNATVEDLLKKLPGLEVDANGNIKAFGERVEKVYVDGEEFFGNDPTIATKNIQAKAVDKVEVYDKKSAEAELTGIEDGEKVKAINLKLKDAYKKGYFGKISASASPEKYYDGTTLFQYYKGKSKFGIYGIGSNTGTVNLNYDDKAKYMGSTGNMMITDEGMAISFNSDEEGSWSGQYNGQGLPKSAAIGSSFSTNLFKDKVKVLLNYGYSSKDIRIKRSEENKYFLPDSSYNQSLTSESVNKSGLHSGSTTIDVIIDSLSSLNYYASGSLTDKENSFFSNTLNTNPRSTSLAKYDRMTKSDIANISFNQTLKFVKKFKDERKLFNVTINISNVDNENMMDVNSFNEYYYLDSNQILKQEVLNLKKDNSKLVSAMYNTPISNKWLVQISSKYINSKSDISRNVYEFDESGKKFPFVSDSLSNDFIYELNGFGAGLNFVRKTEKATLRIGFDGERNKYDFKGSEFVKSKFVKKDTIVFQNRLIPKLSYNYKLNRSSNLRFSYSGYVTPPNVNYLQPVRDNSDPLNITIGNTNLRQSFNQNLNFGYNFWKALSEENLWSNVYISNTFNQIVKSSKIDPSTGRTAHKYINTNGQYYASCNLYYGRKLYKNLNFNAGGNINQSQNISIVNDVESKVKNTGLGPEISLSFEKDEKYYFNVGFEPNWNKSSGGLVENLGNYFSRMINARVSYHFTKKLYFSSEYDYNFQRAASSFDKDFSTHIWNAKLDYKFFKDDDLTMSLGIRDILNQNTGIRRNINSYVVSESLYNTIRRYAYLKLVYNFKSKIDEEPAGDQNIIINN